MPSFVYFGEAAGARILRYGVGVSQVGNPYNLDVRTWDADPAGPVGDVVFRTIEVTLRHRLGYSIEVTPYLDGVALGAQLFSGGPAPASQAEHGQIVTAQAGVGRRGTSLGARIRTLSLLGETEIVDAGYTAAVIRRTP